MISVRHTHPPLVAASTLGAGALALFTWTLVRAMTVSTAGPLLAPAGELPSPGAAETQASPPAPLRAVLDANPFRANRRRPPQRFTLTAPIRLGPPARSTPVVALAGTVVYPDGGGIALVRVTGRASAVMVRVGETVEGLRLRSVAREEAVFARADGRTVVLRVPKAGG